jgi:hypothetical protein
MPVRIGVFFTSVGALILFVFTASYMTDAARYEVCLGGLACLGLGVFLMIKYRHPAEKSDRFRYIRKLRSRKKE